MCVVCVYAYNLEDIKETSFSTFFVLKKFCQVSEKILPLRIGTYSFIYFVFKDLKLLMLLLKLLNAEYKCFFKKYIYVGYAGP